jgi:hypothetical protein
MYALTLIAFAAMRLLCVQDVIKAIYAANKHYWSQDPQYNGIIKLPNETRKVRFVQTTPTSRKH